jgi:SAM-dependent methyltransferase
MAIPSEYGFVRYLSSKKNVDDRALNTNVWQSLCAEVITPRREKPLRVLEVGAGIGTMLERLLDWGLLDRAEYTALDSMEENIAEAASRISQWAKGQGFTVAWENARSFILYKEGSSVRVRLEATDIFRFIEERAGEERWDLLVANAFLDLVDIPAALPKLFSLLVPGGLCYFTITFDGATIFQPEIDPKLDALIESLYHETMDKRITDGRPSGDSRCGRHLFTHLRDAGAEIIDAGASDWVVFGGPHGYPEDEAFFLHFIVHTVGQALEDRPELDRERFARWVAARHQQIEDGTLVYIAHQMDFLGRVGRKT